MSEAEVVSRTLIPLTFTSLVKQLGAAGLAAGQTVLVHSAMSRMGWVVGGPETVVQALLTVLTPTGTLMMPTHSSANSDPAHWANPPVPESWWPLIREHLPAYNPISTPTHDMGAIVEVFRGWPGVMRSSHPALSFAATGPQAHALVSDHSLQAELGEGSPLSRLYELDGYVLLLGVGHANNTSLHLAEHRARWPGKRFLKTGAAMLVEGERRWVQYEVLELHDDDFREIGLAYEVGHPIPHSKVGLAETRLFKQRPLVDFAVGWMERNRHFVQAGT
jgi:aminoglycoside 3-N-acetyltransferase